ncbi:MAG: hypothetical protein LBI09_01650, partial [Nitrososphaerota archaeon]|jgi:hypothetical protein|nr:hypothetical protein [Nitrososphaerota archaeon]
VTDDGQTARFSMVKTVNGVAFSAWINGYTSEEQALILDGMRFRLYADRNGMVDRSLDFAVGKVDGLTGLIDFVATRDVIAEGWYWVVEDLTGAAADVFEPVGAIKIYIGDDNNIGDHGFDYTPLYKINYTLNGMFKLNHPNVNNGGEIFDIAVTVPGTVVSYASFCANAFSVRFAGDASYNPQNLDCEGYVVGVPLANHADFLSAFNYIEDKYGNVAENRIITQVVTWVLLGAIDVNSADFAATNLSAQQRAAVQDVIANYKNYVGNGNIVDLVYLVCEKGHAIESCQPQLVPLYGRSTFDNKVNVTPAVVKNIGFIGYYQYDFGGDTGVKILNTSFYWQELNEGDMIDWVAVDAAYAKWVADGGLAPDRSLWQTSGPKSFTFEDYAAVGYGDFNVPDQLESYYLQFYVDPGYVRVIPTVEIIVSIDPMAVFVGGWSGNTGRFDYNAEFGAVIPIDWDAVYASYSFFGGVPRSDLQDVYLGLTDDKVVGWWTGGAAPQYFEGARPEITAEEGLLDTFFLNSAGLNIIALTPVFKAGPEVLPYEFSVTVYHRALESGEYLVYSGVGETFSNYDEQYIEWLNNVEGFTFINLYLAATRTNDPADMASVEGYVCASVEKDNLLDVSFELTQIGEGEGIMALVTPKAAGHYEITFWYNEVNVADDTLCVCETCDNCGGCIEDDCCDCDDCSPCTCETVEEPTFEIGIFKPQTGSTNNVYINGVLVGTMKVETKTFTFGGYTIQITLNSRGTGNNNWITDFVWKLV